MTSPDSSEREETTPRTYTADEVRGLMNLAADLREERLELTGRAYRGRPRWQDELDRLLQAWDATHE